MGSEMCIRDSLQPPTDRPTSLVSDHTSRASQTTTYNHRPTNRPHLYHTTHHKRLKRQPTTTHRPTDLTCIRPHITSVSNGNLHRHSHLYQKTHSHDKEIRTTTSTVVFYRTRVHQMQPRNGQNWHFSVRKYVHHNRETVKIGICTPLKLYAYFWFVSKTTDI